MPSHEVGVNAHDAYGSGADAEEYASGFLGIEVDFDEAIESAKKACKPDPQVVGWTTFSNEQVEHLQKVERHGVSLGNNVKSGASEAADTDDRSAEEQEEAAQGLRYSPNG